MAGCWKENELTVTFGDGRESHDPATPLIVSRYCSVGMLNALLIAPDIPKANVAYSCGMVAIAKDSCPGVSVDVVIGVQYAPKPNEFPARTSTS